MQNRLAIDFTRILEGRAREAPFLNEIKGQTLQGARHHASAVLAIHASGKLAFAAAHGGALGRVLDCASVENDACHPVEHGHKQMGRASARAAVDDPVRGDIERGNVALVGGDRGAGARKARRKGDHGALLHESAVNDLVDQSPGFGRAPVISLFLRFTHGWNHPHTRMGRWAFSLRRWAGTWTLKMPTGLTPTLPKNRSP